MGSAAALPTSLSLPRPSPLYLFQITCFQQQTNQPFNFGVGDLSSFLKAFGRNHTIRNKTFKQTLKENLT